MWSTGVFYSASLPHQRSHVNRRDRSRRCVNDRDSPLPRSVYLDRLCLRYRVNDLDSPHRRSVYLDRLCLRYRVNGRDSPVPRSVYLDRLCLRYRVNGRDSPVPRYVQVLQESIAKGEDNVLLQTTITLAEVAPKLLRPQLDTIMQLCIKVSVGQIRGQVSVREDSGGWVGVSGVDVRP